MKKFFVLSFFICILVFVFGCVRKNENVPSYDTSNVNYKRSDFKKVADNLYEVEYYDYDIDYMNNELSLIEFEEIIGSIYNARCSCVRKGNYFGRNFDFGYDDNVSIVVKVKGNENRYGSIGVTDGLSLRKNIFEKGFIDTVSQECIPLMIVDGINEKGVLCAINAVPAVDYKPQTIGTNMGAHDLNMYTIPRFVLDKASTAKEAIELIAKENVSIFWDALEIVPYGMEVHIMIADDKNTYIVEFINNKMEVIDVTNDNEKIMTNFYLYYKDEMQPNSEGVERYNIAKEKYDSINNINDMKKVMEAVKVSNRYGDDNGENIWYSDVVKFVAKDGNFVNFGNYKFYIDEVKEMAKNNKNIFIERLNGKNDEYCELTMHTAVYDIENKTMDVVVQERYDEGYYNFKIEN